VALYKLLDIYLLIIPPWYAQLLSDISIRLVKTVHVRRQYPEHRTVLVLRSFAIGQLKSQLYFAYPTKPFNGGLGSLLYPE